MKKQIIEKLIEIFEEKKSLLVRQAVWAQEEANYHKGKMESRYDTFKEEAQYKAEIYLKKAGELSANIMTLKELYSKISTKNEEVKIASIVQITGEKGNEYFMILPFGGGEVININNHEIQIITPSSPLGKALLKSSLYDEIVLDVSERKISCEVLEIQ